MTDLPPFSENARCPKCGDYPVRSTWMDAAPTAPERVQRHCACGYSWQEAPLDATPADDEPEDAYLAGKLAGCEAEPADPYDTDLRKQLDDLADYLMAKWSDRIEEDFGAVHDAISIMEEFRTAPLLEIEPSIPVPRIVAVLAERYLSMYDGKQIRVGVDRANYHIRSLEDAWVSAALGVDHEFDAAIRAELARRKGTA